MKTSILIVLLSVACIVTCGRVYRTIMSKDNFNRRNFERSFNQERDARINGGSLATIDQAPFQVFLFIQSPSDIQAGSGEICGGALIDSTHVMTAAHCMGTDFQNGLRISIYYGGSTPTDSTTGQTQLATAFNIHEGFDMNNGFQNDICLLTVANPISEVSGQIEFVNLASVEPAVGTTLQIQGYGQTFQGENFTATTPITLNLGSAQLAADSTCTDYFNSATIPPTNESFPQNFYVAATDICIGGAVSTCHGDSGGSAVYKVNSNDARWTSVGIVSYGTNTCPGAYNAFTRVSHYVDWVAQNIGASTSAPSTGSPSSQSPSSVAPTVSSPTVSSPTIAFPTDAPVPIATSSLAPGSTSTTGALATTSTTNRPSVTTTTLSPGVTTTTTTAGPSRGANSAGSAIAYSAILLLAATAILL